MKQITQDLEERLSSGEALNIREVALEYYSDESEEIAMTRMRSRLAYIRKDLLKQGIIVVPVGEGYIGIPQSKRDVAYAASFLNNRITAYTAYSAFLYKFAEKKNILPEGFKNKTLQIPMYQLK